jgi:hypothetical protein
MSLQIIGPEAACEHWQGHCDPDQQKCHGGFARRKSHYVTLGEPMQTRCGQGALCAVIDQPCRPNRIATALGHVLLSAHVSFSRMVFRRFS